MELLYDVMHEIFLRRHKQTWICIHVIKYSLQHSVGKENRQYRFSCRRLAKENRQAVVDSCFS